MSGFNFLFISYGDVDNHLFEVAKLTILWLKPQRVKAEIQ